MSRFEADPHPLLRPYISSYWGFVRDFSQMQHFAITPDCFAEVLFFVDPPSVEQNGSIARLSACTLIPLLAEPLRLRTNGMMRCAAIRMHAWAAGMIFAQTDGSTQSWFDVSTTFAEITPQISAALRQGAWTQIASLLDATMLQTVARARPNAAAAKTAVNAFTAAPDDRTPSVADTARLQGLSRRQIERHVRSLTNRSPKQLACLRRFQFVRDTLWARPETALDSLAIEAGYADQAHLTRHFRRYAGQTPSDFKRDCVRLRAFLSREDVAFVQDGSVQPR